MKCENEVGTTSFLGAFWEQRLGGGGDHYQVTIVLLPWVAHAASVVLWPSSVPREQVRSHLVCSPSTRRCSMAGVTWL